MKKLKLKSNLKRKIKILAAAGLVAFLITSALVIWAAVATFNQISTQDLRAQIKELPKVELYSCWGKAQSLLAVQPWLNESALTNLMNLKGACLSNSPTVTVEGKTI